MKRFLGVLGALALGGSAAACGLLASPSPTGIVLPAPTCGGAKILIPGALSCADLAAIAVRTLQAEAPGQLGRGVIAITVDLQGCPRNEVPPQLECGEDDFVQLVTVTFGPSAPDGPIEPSLSVGVAPVTGRVMGIVNPLIR